jgi:prolipoprotein diacylglyceryltransferase
MVNSLVLIGLAFLYLALFGWAFRVLPSEGWQFLASIPVRRTQHGTWEGMNLTYYGLLTSTAVTIAVAVMIVLLGSHHVPVGRITLLIGSLLALTVPAARLVARMVEGKANTFTIGGAGFVGLMAAPCLVWMINLIGPEKPLPAFASLASLAIAYAFGEGTGRIACVSFGCCYGKPLSAAPAWWRHLFSAQSFIFTGETKKAAYEGGFDRVPLVPIQAMTAVVLVVSGLAGLALFLAGLSSIAFAVTLLLTQGWRIVSECFRADYRGGLRLSPYRAMAIGGIAYGALVMLLLPAEPPVVPDLLFGLTMLWDPTILVSLQALWLLLFLYTGRSTVTASHISFSVLRDRI